MDEHDDRYTPENWIKANPILEFDRDALENLIPIAHTARDMGGEDLRDFLVKQLNMWMQWSNSLYIKDIASWKACAVLKSLKAFRGSKCYVGVDLSSGGDLTSIAIVIPFMVEDTKKYFVHTHSFIPSSRVDEHIKTDKVPYDVWIEKGLVTVTETLGGIKTDYKYIIKYLEDLVREYNLKPQLICYDPHNASAFLSDLEAMGFDSISVTQTAKELNDATVDFRLEILAGNVEIEGMEVGKEGNKIVVPVDSLLVWSIANAKTISNNYGEIKIHKPLCMAYGNADDFKAVIKQLNLCEDSILDVYMEHVQEGVTRDKIQSLMSNETWFDSKKMQQYFNVEIEEKAAVAACASDFFEKYNNIPETLKGIDTKDIVDAVIAELENRNNAAAEAEKQRIEAEKQQILDDLYLYGM